MPGPNRMRRRLGGVRYPNIAAHFASASSQYGSVATNATLAMGSNDFTLFGWVNLDSKATLQVLVTKGNSTTNPAQSYVLFYNTATDRFMWLVGNNVTSGQVSADNFGAVAVGQWNFVVATHSFSGGQLSISVNGGTPNTQGYVSGSYNSADDFRFGRQGGSGTAYLNGALDAWGFTATAAAGGGALTAAQISALYKGGVGMAYRDLPADIRSLSVGFWDFDGTLIDSLSVSNLTNNNAVSFVAGKR